MLKTKSIDRLESRMADLSEDSLRYKILESAKNFKTSWVELGQALYSVWKDRIYKDWGYSTFEAYTAKEIGIKKMTAMKLLKSYYFLEKEEPVYLQKDYSQPREVGQLPGYEAVNLLRLAKNNKNLDKDDYARIRESALELGKDPVEIKKDLTGIIRQREELEPEEARSRKRVQAIRRLIGSLKALRTEVEVSKLLPALISKEISALINKVEAEIS